MGFLWDVVTGKQELPVTAAVKPITQAWQLDEQTFSADAAEAWKIWRNVSEVHYVTTQQARLASRIRWDIELNGEIIDTQEAANTMRLVFGRDLREITYQAMLHLQVAGAYYFVRWADTGKWEVLPYPAQGQDKQRIKDNADVTIKVFNPDPANKQRLDSPVIASACISRELMLSRAQARVNARNRTAQTGLLLYPVDGLGETDPNEFEQNLMRNMAAPITNEKSSSAAIPNIVGVEGDKIAQWKMLDVAGNADEKLHERIPALIRQLGVALDIPPEILTGMGESSHWNAWAVQEDNWLGHVEPLAQLIAEGLASGMARAAEIDETTIVVIPDPAPLMQRRPALQDVLAAYEAGLVSSAYAREALGATEEDAPTAEDIRNRQADSVTVEVGDSERTIAEGGGEVAAAPLVAAPEGAPVDFNTERLMAADEQAEDSLIDLLLLALLRVREKVGAKIRAAIQGDPDLREQVKDIPNRDLPIKLGTSMVKGLPKIVRDTVENELLQFDKIIERTLTKIEVAGTPLELSDENLDRARRLLNESAERISHDALNGDATDAHVWVTALRVLGISGGNGDLAPDGLSVSNPKLDDGMPRGIGIGHDNIINIKRLHGVEAVEFEWRYNPGIRRARPHPVHRTLDGVVYDGIDVVRNGGEWHPGDHSGCKCTFRPIWRPVQGETNE